ncbi:hypothetical protein C8R45DRAFT_999686 [Mycena sanguinolenta]|nr:hypothetical protein C8R45DRAFT_999686 [Mycena sanguinolenta]
MRSISSFDRRPLSLVMTMQFDLPVVLSEAETLRIPLASMSKGGAGGIPESLLRRLSFG